MLNPLKQLLVIALFCASTLGNEPYSRVVEQDSGEIVLEMCTRTFEPSEADGPRVHLVSAIHIADQSYYETMQQMLDAYDIVLFEGVKPAGLDPIDPDLDTEAKIAATRDRLRLLVQLASRYHRDHAEMPLNFEALRNADDPRIAAIVESVRQDAWGTRIAVERRITQEGDERISQVVFTSYGADAEQGGEGENADIAESTPRISNLEDPGPSPEGIQTQLANALRVEFQLDQMDTTNPEWVNADMDINQLQDALSEYGDDSLAILDMLEGQSIGAKVAGFILNFVSRSPQLSSMMKLVMMDMLALAEQTDLLAQQEVMHAVIVEGRNQVVIEYLQETLSQHPQHNDIGIFYGAGHMPGLEESLVEMGYEPVADHWVPAMTVNPKHTGLSDTQVRMMRNMIKSSLQQQMGR